MISFAQNILGKVGSKLTGSTHEILQVNHELGDNGRRPEGC